MFDSFPGYSSAIAYDVIQAVDGKLSLAFAIQKPSSTTSDVFFAYLLSNDLSQTNLSALSSLATQVSGFDTGFIIETLRLGSSDDGKRPTLTVEGSLNGKHTLYQLNHDDERVIEMGLPEDITPGKENLISHKTGFNFGQRGNYFLYNIGQTRHLVVQTDGSGGRLDYDYSPGSNGLPAQFQQLSYSCIATATSRQGAMFAASDIYIGSPTGVYRIPNGKSGLMEQVAHGIANIHDITVTYDGNDISVWVTASPSQLYYIYGRRTSATTVTWNMPIQFADNALKVATMRNAIKKSNELFVLAQDESLWHYWQDPASTLWRSSLAVVKEDDFVMDFESYTCHLHFESAGLPVQEQKIQITSSEWQYVTINGLHYSLDIDTPAIVPVDPMGNVTIVSAADDISPPVFHIQSEFSKSSLSAFS